MADPLDELYGLPSAEFTAARDRLVAKLAAAKQRERAREVKALRRPTVAAWVVNQLARRHGAALRRLIDAGDALRTAQRRLVRGGSGDDLRGATKRRQEVLRELRHLAQAILREAGSAAHLDDVLATLEAASVDSEAAKVVTSGRLSQELPRPVGLGDDVPLRLVASRKDISPQRTPPGGRKGQTAEVTRNRERAADAKRLEREAARSAAAAARSSRRRAALDRARSKHEARVRALREELEASERRLRDAETAVVRARSEESRASELAREVQRRAELARAQAKTEG